MECKKNCKYASDCNCYSLYQKLSMNIRRVEKEEDFYSLNVCEQELEGCLEEAIQNPENAMRIIVAQTGLGINVDFIESSLYTTKLYSIYGQKKIMDVYYRSIY